MIMCLKHPALCQARGQPPSGGKEQDYTFPHKDKSNKFLQFVEEIQQIEEIQFFRGRIKKTLKNSYIATAFY